MIARPLLEQHSPLRVTAWTAAIGGAVLLPSACIAGWTVHGAVRHTLSWVSLGHSVLLVTVGGLVVWYQAVSRAGSASVMLWMLAVPVAAALFAAATGAQPLNWSQGAGCVLVIASLMYAQGLVPFSRRGSRSARDEVVSRG
ncbi:EamA family transporter [Streptomyces sp. NPDC050264]|uniref:EamA family transporter n=1 Tax=Streptomyces sp. NPDC050264 TaxID=3155038 RepID=UPI0034372FDC